MTRENERSSLIAVTLLALASLAGCGGGEEEPATMRPLEFTDVSMNESTLHVVVQSDPGARVVAIGLRQFVTADATGRATFDIPLDDLISSRETTLDFSASGGRADPVDATLTLPMTPEAARAGGGAHVTFLGAEGSPPKLFCRAGDRRVDAPYDGEMAYVSLQTDPATEVRVGAELVALDATGRGRAPIAYRDALGAATPDDIGRFRVPFQLTATHGDDRREVRCELEGRDDEAVAALVPARVGQPLFDGDADDATIFVANAPESSARSGFDRPLHTARWVAIATDGEIRSGPPCTGYETSGGAARSISRRYRDASVTLYDTRPVREVATFTVPGGGTGCPGHATTLSVVDDRPTTQAILTAARAHLPGA